MKILIISILFFSLCAVSSADVSFHSEYYRKVGHCSKAQGRVLNIGLGDGYAADHLLDNLSVDSIVSVDISQEIIDSYRSRRGDNPRHLIIAGDARIVPITGRFNLVYIDIMDDYTREYVAVVKSIVTRVSSMLNPDGVIIIEWYADVPLERALRQWMADNFQEAGIEWVSDGTKQNSGHVQYWKKR